MGESTKRGTVLKAMQRLMRPVVRLALRNAIKLPDLIEIAKLTFIDVATEELLKREQAISGSRVSAMTGVHRKDVARITGGENPQQTPNLISRVMVQWRHDKDFCTKDNKPRVLTAEGKDSEFCELVRSTNGADINPYTILFEMERMGAVERKDGKVKLCWAHFVPPPNIEQGLMMLAEDSEDLASAVEENIFDQPAVKNLHLKTEFDSITPAALPEIRQWLLTEGSAFHEKVRKYLAQFDTDLNPKLPQKPSKARVAFGAFSFTADEKRKKGDKK